MVVMVLLTTTTQVGGVIYLISLLVVRHLNLKLVMGMGVFVGLYLMATFILLPIIAPVFGRTALPLTGALRPPNLATCLFNRHYVVPTLKRQLVAVSSQMVSRFPNTRINYLDANFPFITGFPLFPHLSHNDGKKIDLAFLYEDKDGPTNSAPSFIGYGVYEEPRDGEEDYPNMCRRQGFWQYSLISSIVPQGKKEVLTIDVRRTKELIKLLARDDRTSKIFIEPHLKTRWRLSRYDNIRFHGCQAVRHDDHIHTQVY